MREYVLAKVIALGIPIVLIGYGFLAWAGSTADYWWFLLVVTMILGYTHFWLGFYYQLRSFRRYPRAKRAYVAFLVLAILSLVVCYWFIANNYLTLLATIVIGYFLIHGGLNEKTILTLQTGYTLPITFFMVVATTMMTILYSSLTHASSFFNQSLIFVPTFPAGREWAISQGIGMDAVLLPLVTGALSVVGAVYVVFKYPQVRLQTAPPLVFCVGAIGITYFWYPLSYVHWFHLALSYHFIVWSLVFLFKYQKERPALVPSYVGLHLIFLVGLMALAMTGTADSTDTEGWLYALVFNTSVYAAISFVHISTSFLNEDWIKQYFQ